MSANNFIAVQCEFPKQQKENTRKPLFKKNHELNKSVKDFYFWVCATGSKFHARVNISEGSGGEERGEGDIVQC